MQSKWRTNSTGRTAHHRALFSPSVQAGLLKPSDLAGWRNDQVFIRGAMHVPLSKEAVRDCMPVLFELIASEPHPGVRAVLGHFFFVYIHPYMDGNGRLGRFLMNSILASGGYVWTVVPVQQRKPYMQALDSASAGHDITGFAAFIGKLIREQTAAPCRVWLKQGRINPGAYTSACEVLEQAPKSNPAAILLQFALLLSSFTCAWMQQMS